MILSSTYDAGTSTILSEAGSSLIRQTCLTGLKSACYIWTFYGVADQEHQS